MSLLRSAPEISTKPLARALRKFAAQRDCLTISVIKTRCQPPNRLHCVLCSTPSARTHLLWRVPKLQVQHVKTGDARPSVHSLCIMIILEHRKAYAAVHRR
jgi:hypothetical protein